MSSPNIPAPSLPPGLLAEEVDLLVATDLASTSQVELSNELVGLLSTQLYRTPLKAIEELVVNSYDADANDCCLAVPSPSEVAANPAAAFVAVWDDGKGMDAEGLVTLWSIGTSPKTTVEYQKKFRRKQIGKFGIGKLATHAIAQRITYLSRASKEVHAVTINYRDFSAGRSGSGFPVLVQIARVTDWPAFQATSRCASAINALGLTTSDERWSGSWTLVILEELKPKAQDIKLGRLKWVLRTAMPLQPGFRLVLNGEEVTSAKDDFSRRVEFRAHELPKERLDNLRLETGNDWRVKDDALICEQLPNGLRGVATVFDRSLVFGKSDDILRSHGFFVRTRDRLINEDDPLFGLTSPRSYKTFNRFRADVTADDLHAVLLSSREEVESSPQKKAVEGLLGAIFNEARKRYEDSLEALFRDEEPKREHERQFVAPRLVERPLADVLSSDATRRAGADADEHWFYLKTNGSVDLSSVLDRLYSGRREPYRYQYEKKGGSGRMVEFDPSTATFTLNEQHDFVLAHKDEPAARRLLHDIVTAETLLEVYLRESGVIPELVGEVLEQRDRLLRGLTQDHLFSFAAIAASLRDAVASKHDLEIALVRAARAVGFVAKHISKSGEPDGLARLMSHPDGESTITLEAKSSEDTPSVKDIDFAALAEHVRRYNCVGCLLLAPKYPNLNSDDSATANRARAERISCWAVQDFARVIEQADARHITAQQILEIVVAVFAPGDVHDAVERLLSEPRWAQTALHVEVLQALKRLQNRLPDRPRSIEMIATEVSRCAGFESVQVAEIRQAVQRMEAASKGGILLMGKDSETIRTNIALEELANRLGDALPADSSMPRGRGGFLAANQGEEHSAD